MYKILNKHFFFLEIHVALDPKPPLGIGQAPTWVGASCWGRAGRSELHARFSPCCSANPNCTSAPPGLGLLCPTGPMSSLVSAELQPGAPVPRRAESRVGRKGRNAPHAVPLVQTPAAPPSRRGSAPPAALRVWLSRQPSPRAASNPPGRAGELSPLMHSD